jgi:uracil-DNA glycosylase family 4
VRCAPPQNKPTPDERDRCATWLDREWALVAPYVEVVVTLGAFGWAAALGMLARGGVEIPRPRPRFGHGAEVTLGERTLLGCYHPSQHNTATGRLTAPMLDEVLGRAATLATMPA